MENENTTSNSARFYEECSNILGLIHNHVEPVPKRNRWNNRTPGNGRYEGYGLIRFYNSELIHVQFASKGSGIFKSEDEVFEFLKKVKQES